MGGRFFFEHRPQIVGGLAMHSGLSGGENHLEALLHAPRASEEATPVEGAYALDEQ